MKYILPLHLNIIESVYFNENVFYVTMNKEVLKERVNEKL